ncbi:HEAT repeat domain-containing protein [Janthinobacterium sp. FW305-129]|uniref:HEAT repeat domain-containing protein n=1 Tax=Janthinobacterium sp. FW305-129 TaxID=2775054 RepID=UPI001E2993E0|nr:HEAT repeat domain-containing protein [Janthinobacterium sp. FW305-129]MCC7597251.1 HEAT repeat domain-containing protein [Janthinobacterium sp. FW305-129]
MAGTDLAQLLLKHSVTVMLLFCMLRLLHRASASRRVFATRCGLVALLLMPLFWLWLPQLSMRMPLAMSALLDPPLRIPASVATAALPDIDAALAAPARAAWLGRWLLAAYAVGVLCHLLRLALNLVRLRQATAAAQVLEAPAWSMALQRLRLSLGLRRSVRLLVSEPATSPYSWGWRHPVIVLDRHSVGNAEADAVLAHELAHIRAHDWPMLLLARMLLALYWWHPLMYPLLRMLEHDTECAADDAVLAAGATPSRYAHTLLMVSRQAFGAEQAGQPAAGMANRIASRGAMLGTRIAALLEAHRPRGLVTLRQWWSGMLASVALVCVIGSITLQGEQVLWPDSLLPAPNGQQQDPVALLHALGNPNFTQLSSAMRARDYTLRHAAETESFRQRAAIPALLLALRDPQPVVRQLAVWALGEMRFAETAPAVAALLADHDAAVRAEAAAALGDMDERRWLAPMIAMLGDKDALVRRRVAHALGDLQAGAAMPMLQSRLNDPVPDVASEVRWALGEMR